MAHSRSIDGVVFDLDGTLIDSAPDIRTSLNLLLNQIDRRPLGLDEVISMIGEGAEMLVSRALAATGDAADRDSVVGLTRRFVALYESCGAAETKPYPGVAATLAVLRAEKFRLGLCTNKPEGATKGLMSALGLDDYFSAVVGGDTLKDIRKPDPRPVQAVLEALDVVPVRSVLIGDSRTDVLVARAAGMRVWLRRGGYTTVPAEDLGADGVFGGFDELPALLRQLP